MNRTPVKRLIDIHWDYQYLYWHQNLVSAEAQQVLFAMQLRSLNQPSFRKSNHEFKTNPNRSRRRN